MKMNYVIHIIHLKGEDIEVAITHNNDYGEDIFSFVNGNIQHRAVHTSRLSEKHL